MRVLAKWVKINYPKAHDHKDMEVTHIEHTGNIHRIKRDEYDIQKYGNEDSPYFYIHEYVGYAHTTDRVYPVEAYITNYDPEFNATTRELSDAAWMQAFSWFGWWSGLCTLWNSFIHSRGIKKKDFYRKD